jgi:hypothetical protein
LRLSGQAASDCSTSTRTKTRAPGAWAASFAISSGASTAKRSTPTARAKAMSRGFFTVLPKLMRSGVAPAARHSSISPREAASKPQPSAARRASTAGCGFALTA